MPVTEEDLQIARSIRDQKTVILVNKSDLPAQATLLDVRAILEGAETLALSAATGEGVSSFEDFLVRVIYGGKVKQSESLLVTNARHLDALEKTISEIDSAAASIHAGMALDFVEVSIRAAYDQIGEITGDTVSDDILDRVFSRFCVGK
jgi:tRNA modification GTPase